MPANSSRPPAARCSSTRSANCRCRRRSSSCARIQEGEIEPVGARKPVKVDVRLISATNRNLIDDVKAGRFREDLFYRLHVFPIAVPPLRERPEDIADLVRHFLARFAAEEGKRIRAIAPDALALLNALSLAGQCPAARERGVPRRRAGGERRRSAATNFPQIARNAAARWRRGPAPSDRFAALPSVNECRRLRSSSGIAADSSRGRPARTTLALLDPPATIRPLEEIETEAHPFRHRPLPRANVGSCAPAADRTLDPLPQARDIWAWKFGGARNRRHKRVARGVTWAAKIGESLRIWDCIPREIDATSLQLSGMLSVLCKSSDRDTFEIGRNIRWLGSVTASRQHRVGAGFGRHWAPRRPLPATAAAIEAAIPRPDSAADLPPPHALAISIRERRRRRPRPTTPRPQTPPGPLRGPMTRNHWIAAAAPAANTAAPADTSATVACAPTHAKPMDAAAIKAPTGKDLVKAPIATRDSGRRLSRSGKAARSARHKAQPLFRPQERAR